MLFLHGVQLVIKSSPQFKVDVTMKNAKIFSSVLFGENGSADGWQCC